MVARSNFEVCAKRNDPYKRHRAAIWHPGALAGFRYSAAQRTFWFAPHLSVRLFKTFFSTASGFGTITLDAHTLRIQMLEGDLPWKSWCCTKARKLEYWSGEPQRAQMILRSRLSELR